MKKISKSILLPLMVLCIGVVLTACGGGGGGTPIEPTKLSTPTDIRVIQNEIWWDNYTANATGYTVIINGTEYTQTNTGFKGISHPPAWAEYAERLPVGRYVISVRANGDGTNYSNSDFVKIIHTSYSDLIYSDFENGYELAGIGAEELTSTVYIEPTVVRSPIENIKAEVFKNQTIITSVELPKHIKTISQGAFSGCSNLASIVIQDEITTIANDAFEGCSSLAKIFYGGTDSEVWAEITANLFLNSATVYYYSETQPSESGYHWHWVDGAPVIW